MCRMLTQICLNLFSSNVIRNGELRVYIHFLELLDWRSVLDPCFKLSSIIIPPLHRRGDYTVLPLSVRPSKIFFVTFFSATIDGRNVIFGHKLHISAPYRGKRFWTCHIPTSCLPTWLVFIHIEHTVDSHCLEFGWLEFPVESNCYRSPKLRCV